MKITIPRYVSDEEAARIAQSQGMNTIIAITNSATETSVLGA